MLQTPINFTWLQNKCAISNPESSDEKSNMNQAGICLSSIVSFFSSFQSRQVIRLPALQAWTIFSFKSDLWRHYLKNVSANPSGSPATDALIVRDTRRNG